MSTELEDRLRAVLSVRAQDPEAAPSAALTERVVRRASRMRRARRLQVAAGVAVVALVVAAVPLLVGQQRADGDLPVQTPWPTPTPATSGAPAANAVAMARSTGALLASGMTILDGGKSVEVRPYNPPPEGWTYAIHRVSRPGDGYWVMYGPEALFAGLKGDDAQRPPEKLAFVTEQTADGRAVPLSVSPDAWSALVVDPGSAYLAYGASTAAGTRHHLLLAEEGVGMGGRIWPQPVNPLGFGPESVWFSAAVDPGGPPYQWRLAANKTVQLAVSQASVALTMQGTRMVLRDYLNGCASGMDVTDVRHPESLWTDCSGGIDLARFSPDGSLLMTVVSPAQGDQTLQLRDPGSGRVVAHVVLPEANYLSAAWSSDGQSISLGACCEDESTGPLVSVSVAKDSTGWTLRPTTYPPAEGDTRDVVLGVEPDQR